ncbi:unnamed protein product [Cyclocybe aegerita]|uniref:Uncharacterized protein n=1 Tax=Cyclocybe aegerita TaxID=1973307 RepID=A0A8S0VSL2_CYCAE|nr:unnamed protein product [Cyclocybe aegerita]
MILILPFNHHVAVQYLLCRATGVFIRDPGAMTSASDPPRTKDECRIAEIVQHTCELRINRLGQRTLHCFPIPRLLKLCPGKPAVEITKLVHINVKNGEVEIPKDLSVDSLQAHPWREVVRYDQAPMPE